MDFNVRRQAIKELNKKKYENHIVEVCSHLDNIFIHREIG